MKPFTKLEIKSIFLILSVLFIVVFVNMLASLRRGRDSIRKNDIYAVEQALDTFYQKYKFYPKATADGKIIGCFSGGVIYDEVTGLPTNMEVCEWGKSTFEDLRVVPNDPNYKKGVSYRYTSETLESYFFYISLEGKNEPEYTKNIVNKNLQCGNEICNYGRGTK